MLLLLLTAEDLAQGAEGSHSEGVLTRAHARWLQHFFGTPEQQASVQACSGGWPLTLPHGCLQTDSVMQSAESSLMDTVPSRAPSQSCSHLQDPRLSASAGVALCTAAHHP